MYFYVHSVFSLVVPSVIYQHKLSTQDGLKLSVQSSSFLKTVPYHFQISEFRNVSRNYGRNVNLIDKLKCSQKITLLTHHLLMYHVSNMTLWSCNTAFTNGYIKKYVLKGYLRLNVYLLLLIITSQTIIQEFESVCINKRQVPLQYCANNVCNMWSADQKQKITCNIPLIPC